MPSARVPASEVKPLFVGDALAVSKRVGERWNALVKHDFEAAWGLISPAGRQAFPLETYKSRIKALAWKGVEVSRVDCEADRCSVTLSLSLDDVRTGPISTVITETWVKQDGNWWFLYRG